MAGMLPGVESARRRRFHVSSSESHSTSFASSRRTSFCLYATSSHDNLFSSSSSMQRNQVSQAVECDDSRLSDAAREAKRRLDERLWKSQSKRNVTSQQRLRSSDTPTIQASTQAELPTLKRSGSKRLKWLKLNWKSSEQEECSVCLEQLKNSQGETIMQLPCAHKFHLNCLSPWLESSSHCPYCRTKIPS